MRGSVHRVLRLRKISNVPIRKVDRLARHAARARSAILSTDSSAFTPTAYQQPTRKEPARPSVDNVAVYYQC